MPTMDLSVITVTWNSAEHIAEQIRSVAFGCKNIEYEQIVVDNGSSDKTTDIIRRNFRNVQVIENQKNTGFAAANNQGAAVSSGRYLLFLNPDMKVGEGSLDKIVEWMDSRPNTGLSSCKLVNKNGHIEIDAKPRRFPTLQDQLALTLKIHHIFPALHNRYLMKDMDPDSEQSVDSVRGSFVLMRREIYDFLGWVFDPGYYIWFEDVDLCKEVRRLGFDVTYTPVISCVDFVGQSFKKRNSLWKQKQFAKSMLIYFKKWHPWYMWIWIALSRQIGISLVWVKEKLKI